MNCPGIDILRLPGGGNGGKGREEDGGGEGEGEKGIIKTSVRTLEHEVQATHNIA